MNQPLGSFSSFLRSALLILLCLLGVFPLDVILPSFPALADEFRVEPQQIAYSVSFFAFGVALAQLVIGRAIGVDGQPGADALSILGGVYRLWACVYRWRNSRDLFEQPRKPAGSDQDGIPAHSCRGHHVVDLGEDSGIDGGGAAAADDHLHDRDNAGAPCCNDPGLGALPAAGRCGSVAQHDLVVRRWWFGWQSCCWRRRRVADEPGASVPGCGVVRMATACMPDGNASQHSNLMPNEPSAVRTITAWC